MTNPGSCKTVGEEWLAAYSAGSLSPAKQLLIDCQASMQPDLRTALSRLDHVGGALLESAEGRTLSQGFIDNVLQALDGPEISAGIDTSPAGEKVHPDWMPAPLSRFMDDARVPLEWRSSGPSIKRAPLCEDESGEQLYLLRAPGGTKIPAHGHRGEEWTLVLQGSYHVGPEGFFVGDLHSENEDCIHNLVIDEGEICICLVAIEGKLKFSNPLLKLLQPFLGV